MAGDVRKHLFQGIAPVSGDEARGRLAVHDLALQMDTKVASLLRPLRNEYALLLAIPEDVKGTI